MNILIVDDHPLVCHALAGMLALMAPGAQVRMAHTLSDALSALSGQPAPDWIFLDLNLPDDPDKKLFSDVCTSDWALKTVLISAEMPLDLLRLALGAGIRGFVAKSADPEQIRACFNTVSQGGVFLAEELRRRIDGCVLARGDTRPLSPRLLEVQQWLLKGAANKVIAREMRLSEHTVKEYVSSLLAWHQVGNRLELVLKLKPGT